MEPDLKILETVPTDDEKAILDALKAYNNTLLGPTDRRGLFIPLKDADGRTDGGLVGYTGRGWLYVEMLFVPERLRGQGLAGRLLQTAEDEAKGRGCTGAYVDTINPKARSTYERQGYAVFGTLDNFSGDFSITWLMKRF
ncbi:MAG: GNAT family N-acetyltransferase [Allorhizobium sp.]